MRKLAILLLASGVFAPCEILAREGFGFTKKAVMMTRTNPPQLAVGARRVKVTATAEREPEKDDAVTLRRHLEDFILSGAGTMAPEKEKGEIRIAVAVDRLDAHESWETEQKTRYEKTGEKQEWNEKKKKYETKPVYGNVSYTVQNKVIDANLSGTWDLTDKNGNLVDSGNISERFRESYSEGKGSPAPSRVEDGLLKRAAKEIASRIVPTQESISVLVPKGSFEDLIPLAEMNAWDRYLAGVEAVRPNRDARQEAYRQYALGVAKEGLAHSAAVEEPERTIELLREAVVHYETAVKSNPREDLFAKAYSSLLSTGTSSAPLPRAGASLTAFEKWTGPVAPRPRSTVAAASKDVMTNQTVVEMAKAGLADENLIMAIDAAATVDFDTSPNALIALAKGGVSRNVIAHMQKKRSTLTR
ncbi:MAG TPA: hypothetical protein VM779_06730 [Thermoanaerobaculia bacterium]|nr:hypothetical protein [Thermoanaerobaculia bacterium]